MEIGLKDIDSHNFPNLALMKISTYEKNKGNNVSWHIPIKTYDKVYISKIFTFTPDYIDVINSKEIIKGGTGYDLNTKLDNSIEKSYPDYDLYNIKNVAYGYLTRGCPRKCDFCIVSEKEGCKSYKVSNIESFWNGQKEIKLLDPNLLSYKRHNELLDQLIKTKAWIDFTQGLDCRFLNETNIEKILSLKIKMIHFAWDKQKDEDIIIKKLELFNKYSKLNQRKKRVYILTNFDTNFEYDLYRIETLKNLNYDPYVMIYEKEKCKKKYRQLQRYVNNKYIFYSTKNFDEYINSKGKKYFNNQISILEEE